MDKRFSEEFGSDFRSRRNLVEKQLPAVEKYTKKLGKKETKGKHGFGVYDSPIESYEENFYDLLPEKQSLKGYIEKFLAEKKGKAVGLELGGTGSRMFGSFESGLFEDSAGIALGDPRTNGQKIEDERHHHTVISGNIISKETKAKIEEWLKGRKIDFLIERVVGGGSTMPYDTGLVVHEMRYWYSLMNEESLMLLQKWGNIHGLVLEKWAETVNADQSNKIEVKYPGLKVLSIKKLKGATPKLPYLK